MPLYCSLSSSMVPLPPPHFLFFPLLLLQMYHIRSSISFITVYINKIVVLNNLPHTIPKPSYTAMVISYIVRVEHQLIRPLFTWSHCVGRVLCAGAPDQRTTDLKLETCGNSLTDAQWESISYYFRCTDVNTRDHILHKIVPSVHQSHYICKCF